MHNWLREAEKQNELERYSRRSSKVSLILTHSLSSDSGASIQNNKVNEGKVKRTELMI